MKKARTALVITSISAPNAVLRAFAEGCTAHGIGFTLIGDRPSPPDFSLEGCDFWGLERQRTMPFALARILPERHYARKNLGYLHAIANGAEVILESDDDNFPRAEFWAERTAEVEAEVVAGTGWANLYRLFTPEPIWPRGFPLEHLQDPAPVPGPAAMRHCPVQQGLADENPDVDAIYRLTGKLPVDFERRAQPVALEKGAWCPFNSQNTTWFREVFPLLYLPAHCSFRMTDIWRGYVALRILHENGHGLLFHNATVWQERNAHDLMKDFADETIGYLNNREVYRRLEELTLRPGAEHVVDNMRRCYEVFIGMGLVGPEERPLLGAWAADMAAMGL